MSRTNSSRARLSGACCDRNSLQKASGIFRVVIELAPSQLAALVTTGLLVGSFLSKCSKCFFDLTSLCLLLHVFLSGFSCTFHRLLVVLSKWRSSILLAHSATYHFS